MVNRICATCARNPGNQEAWHRSFNATVGCHHPTIWKFIAALKREQGLVEVRQARFLAGNAPTKRKRSVWERIKVFNFKIEHYILYVLV